MFNNYQKEQNAIMDEQLKGIQKYLDSYQTLSDADVRVIQIDRRLSLAHQIEFSARIPLVH